MADYSDTLEKLAAHHVEDTLGQGALVDAKQASDEEHSQTLWQAISANHKAVAWSVLISLSIIMEGYDVILIGNFFGYPQFAKEYGHDYGGSIGWQVSTPWQTALLMASAVGTVIGMSGRDRAEYLPGIF
jgi:SP family general alpha glucoside:H+ symporter-like MFS transporter